MKSVFIVHHIHEFDDGHEDHKIIGVFASHSEAQAALDLVKDQPGFREEQNGFEIAEWELGRIGWRERYVTICPEEE